MLLVSPTHENSISPLVHREEEVSQRSHEVAKSIALIAGGLILLGITVGFGAAGLAHGTMLLKWEDYARHEDHRPLLRY